MNPAEISAPDDKTDKPLGLMQKVVAGGYCVGCGACAATPDSPLSMHLDEYGTYRPVSSKPDTDAGIPDDVCPFSDGNLSEDGLLPANCREGARFDPAIGAYRRIWAGYCIEPPYRDKGSSGGLGNWVAAELLRRQLVDGVIHVLPSSPAAHGPLFAYGISRTADELGRGAKSRYYPVEISQVMALVRAQPGRYAFIGVPCFVKAIRLLCQRDPELDAAITFTLSLFCGHLKSTAFAEHAAWQMGIAPDELLAFDFRVKAHGQPANRYAVSAQGQQSGSIVSRTSPTKDLFGSDWGMGFFKLKACDYCDDIVGETADISLGDAWLPEYVRDSRGTNVAIARHPLLVQILEEARREGRIALDPLDVASIVRSQDSNYKHRRDGLAYRLALQAQAGHWYPPKRIRPDANGLDDHRKRVMGDRIRLRDESHRAFAEAKAQGQLERFDEIMRPLTEEYRRHLQEPRRAQPVESRKPPLPARGYYSKRIMAAQAEALRFFTAPRRSALVLFPAARLGGAGDDAMVSATIGKLRQSGHTRIHVAFWKEVPGDHRLSEAFDGAIQLSGFMGSPQTEDETCFIRISHRYSHFFIVGADVLDGYYSDLDSEKRLHLALWAAISGMRVTLLGFSYNDAPKERALKALRDLPDSVRICARDPVSFQRISNFLGRPPIQAADVAFLLKPSKPENPDLNQWLADARERKVLLVGINAIITSLFHSDSSEETLHNYLDFYVELIQAIAASHPDSRFVFIPHDYRPRGIGEGPLLHEIYYRCPVELQARIHRPNAELTAGEIKWLCGQLDFVISSRMHLAIAAIGQGVPAFCFAYQGKFEGLFQLIEMPEMLMEFSDAQENKGHTIEHILGLIDTRTELTAKLKQGWPRIEALSLHNFE